MEFPIISAATAAILLAMQQLLMLNVGLTRRSLQQGVGYGDNPDLERVVRHHGNLAENAAIFVVTLGFLELSGGVGVAVPWLAALFVGVRLSHIVAFSARAGSHGGEGRNIFMLLRMVGGAGSGLLGLTTAGLLIYAVLSG
jgi:uncharacterized membrane protein YecN with MAPEG domain